MDGRDKTVIKKEVDAHPHPSKTSANIKQHSGILAGYAVSSPMF